MKNYNGMPKEFTERIEILVKSAVNDSTIKEMMSKCSNEGKIDLMANLILAAI